MSLNYRHFRESLDLQEKPSTVYLRGVGFLCIAVQVWKHPGLLHLLPVPISIYLIKTAFLYFQVISVMLDSNAFSKKYFFQIDQKLSPLTSRVRAWLSARSAVLFPGPARALFSVLSRAERALFVTGLPQYTDALVTTALILLLIVGVVFASVFVGFELYAESAYMIQTSGQLVGKLANSSVFRQLNDSLWDPGVDNVLETAYHSGRGYIAGNIHTWLGREEDDQAMQEIETKVLELWDRLYQYWLSRRALVSNVTATEEADSVDSATVMGPNVSGEAITSSLYDIMDSSTDFFNYSAIMTFLKENMDTVRAIVEQAWVLLQGNLRLVVTLVLEVVRVLASSGSGVVNVFLSFIVYFTALFYLLANSSHGMYKPVEVRGIY